MKRLFAIGFSLLVLVGFSANAVAWDKADLDKLWKTNQCPKCDLAGALLSKADLRNSNLAGANLQGIDLRWAKLNSANLQGANLRGAYLYGAILYGAKLTSSDFTGVTLCFAGNSGCAKFCDTTMPNGSTNNSGCGAVATSVPSTPTPTPTPEPKDELVGTGTGFVVSKKYVVTAEHVLDGCKSVSIAHGHEEMNAQTVSRDKNNDLGLLKIEKPMANTAKLRGSPDLRVGDTAINYGYLNRPGYSGDSIT